MCRRNRIRTPSPPVELALHIMDWRAVHLIVAGLILAAASLVITVAPENKSRPL